MDTSLKSTGERPVFSINYMLSKLEIFMGKNRTNVNCVPYIIHKIAIPVAYRRNIKKVTISQLKDNMGENLQKLEGKQIF